MADYPNMVFETFPSQTSHAGDDVSGCAFEVFPAQTSYAGDDVLGFSLENFASPYVLGFTTCREVGYYRYWINKVWDPNGPGGGQWVLWESELDPDRTGERFPDPYQTGWATVAGSYRAWYYLVVDGNDLQFPLYPPDQDYGYDG